VEPTKIDYAGANLNEIIRCERSQTSGHRSCNVNAHGTDPLKWSIII